MADILRYAQTMTDQPQSADEPEVREITFRERVLLVKMPSPEQLVVWKRIATQIERLNEAPDSSAYSYIKMIDRSRSVIDSVLVSENDKDWLDDLLLEHGLTLNEAMDIIIKTIEAFTPEQNRAEKRAATPKKRARLKTTPVAPS